MKIAIDIDDLSRPLTGIGRYSLNLIYNMLLMSGNNEFHLYHLHGLIESELLKEILNKSIINKSNAFSTTFWSQALLPYQSKKDNVNVLLSPSVRSPIISLVPSVMTIHDLIPFSYPNYFPLFDRIYMKTLLLAVAKTCDHFIAVSHSTKNDIINYLHVSEDKISVVYHGIEEKFNYVEKKIAANNLRNAKIDIPDPYILYVGTIEPRKNIANLVKAYFQLVKRGCNHKLVIAGKRGWGAEDFWSLSEHELFADNVILLGHIADEMLPMLYAGADIFVYPSLFEGFGFPPLEAMACGTPVIINNTPTLVEVCGDAAITTDARSCETLANSIFELLYSREKQKDCIYKGLQRVKEFTWKSAANKTIKILQKCAK